MANILLKCPHCGKTLQIPSVAGLEQKSATCPSCNKPGQITEFYPKYSLSANGSNYQLRLGRQWVGRQASNSTADIQIPEPDNSHMMSRKHAVIELKCTAAGIVCTFEEHGANPTSLQGIELIKDDIIYLNINDCLKMGNLSLYLTNEFA